MDQSLIDKQTSQLKKTDLPDYAVEVRNLVKVYGRGATAKRALDGLSLNIPRGSIFGLLGPNGAGKSTMINIMAGLVLKTAGEVKVWGRSVSQDPRGAKAAIGVVPQELNLDPFFTPRELLDVQAGMFGVPAKQRRTAEILEMVGLADKADSYARALSGGMRRRLLVAKAMVHSPPVLVLDEPTAGVDVELRRQLWEQVRGLNARGVTILLTTHYLEEAEQLCDRIAIIDKGHLLACDTKDNLLNKLDSKRLVITLQTLPDPLPQALESFEVTVVGPDQIEVVCAHGDGSALRVLDGLRQAGLVIRDMSTKEAGLEEVFLHLTSPKKG
jgi:ABC-2 type transport system ATP-binding protein